MVTPLTATTVANPAELNARFDEIGGQVPVTGMMALYAGASTPTGWLLCNGAAVSRSTYAALFALMGTAFGAGDGSTTFNVPDCRGRTPIGVGQGAGLTNRAMGDTLGEETHLLTVDEMAAHHHITQKLILQADQFAPGSTRHGVVDMVSTQGTWATGNNEAHNNMQPSIALNFIIKV